RTNPLDGISNTAMLNMLKNLSFVILLMALPRTASSQQASNLSDAHRLADEATETARIGKFDDALRLYGRALAVVPDDISILRDYAVVLGWAEKYSEAVPVIRRVLSAPGEQPDWALREFSRSLLFGDATEEALQQLNQLVERGDFSEGTLARRALALRWLGHGDDAAIAYEEMRRRHPQSAVAYA